MGWKIVRDRNEEWCRAHGVSGQWRTSPDPVAALRKKIFEEIGEYAEHHNPGELYDLLDVIQALIALNGRTVLRGLLLYGVKALIALKDPDGAFGREHAAKAAEMGGFTRYVEWCPVPEGDGDG